MVSDGATLILVRVTSGVNDLADELKSTVRLFAHHALLYSFIDSHVDLYSLQNDAITGGVARPLANGVQS